MAFIITKDHIEKGRAEGTMGPRGISKENVEKLKALSGDGDDSAAMRSDRRRGHFKMYDDDGEIYYEGFWFDHTGEGDPFEPLDCYGMPNAGCTYLEMRNKEGIYSVV